MVGGSGVVSDTERIFNDLIDDTREELHYVALHNNCWLLKNR
jgi:hypothetical protein